MATFTTSHECAKMAGMPKISVGVFCSTETFPDIEVIDLMRETLYKDICRHAHTTTDDSYNTLKNMELKYVTNRIKNLHKPDLKFPENLVQEDIDLLEDFLGYDEDNDMGFETFEPGQNL